MAKKSKKAEIPSEDIATREEIRVEVVDVPTANVFTLGRGVVAVAADALVGAFVKLAPRLSPGERESFDAAAARESFLSAGARAVVVAPTYEAEERGAVPARAGGVDARAELRAWFDGGVDADAPAALEACLRIADEVGL